MDLSAIIAPAEWATYRDALHEFQRRGLKYLVGGGIAYSNYSKRCRDTKDLDLFVLPQDVQDQTRVLDNHGFEDYFGQKEYDRSWIYRSHKDGRILDLIWTMPNHRFDVCDDWFARASSVCVHGESLKVVSAEDLIRSKIYVMQRDRCDWGDLFNLLEQTAEQLDWGSLLRAMGPDLPLLASLVSVYAWIRPERKTVLPKEALDCMTCAEASALEQDRSHLLDTRDWFGACKDCDGTC